MHDVPYGYCECGCGQKTRLATQSKIEAGWVRGRPLRYILGHSRRQSGNEYEIDSNGCWIWQLSTKGAAIGYGQLKDPTTGTNRGAHVVFYERHKGPVPSGMELDHLCRVRRCVNPDHLEPVTRQVNTQRGACAKLTPDAVLEIRASSATYAALAHVYGVTEHTIWSVRARRTWDNV